jgi:hypothetical protein
VDITDPPPQKRGRGSTSKWKEIVHTLKTEYPGQFAKVGSYSNGVATQIRQGKYAAFVPENYDLLELLAERKHYIDTHWEITTRRKGQASDIYIKWLGKDCSCRYCGAGL